MFVFVAFDFVFQYLAKRLAGKSVSEMTYFNSINQSINQSPTRTRAPDLPVTSRRAQHGDGIHCGLQEQRRQTKPHHLRRMIAVQISVIFVNEN